MLDLTIRDAHRRFEGLSRRLVDKRDQLRSSLSHGVRIEVRKTLIRHWDATEPLRYPTKIQIEPTSKCNLRCTSCPHAEDNFGGRHLERDELAQILDRIPHLPRVITLSGVGEPLLHPQLFALVDTLSSRNVRSRFFTNGTLLSAKVRGEILDRPDITGVCISCDSSDPAAFEATRVGAKFDLWMQRVRAFLAEAHARRRKGQSAPYTSMFTVIGDRFNDTAPDLVQFAATLGFQALVFFDPIPLDEAIAVSEVEQRGVVQRGKQLGIDVEVCARRGLRPPRARVRCTQPWDYVFIRAGGNVAPCRVLADADREPVMGNLFEQTLEEIWYGERFRDFRRASAGGDNALCTRCPYY